MDRGWRDAISDLFHRALAHPREDRGSFLKEACAGDDCLRQEIESLLRYDSASASFLETPSEIALLLSAPAARLALGTSLGAYRLEAVIGSGGMGEVYRAHDSKLERTVAIKVLREGILADSTRRRRLISEARAASALNHPNVVAIYDIENAAGVDYIAMEHVDGVPLHQLIADAKVRLEQAVDISVQIARGMAAAHGIGLIHRDLKPANVLVSSDGHVKIIDFGLSKRTERVTADRSLHTGTLATHVIEGTPGYAAPEQVQGEATDARTDVFAIGAILYELLTGQPAFDGLSPADRLAATLRDVPRAVDTVRRDVPHALHGVLALALAKRPEDRYPSAVELLADLVAVQQALVAGRVRIAELLRRPAVAAPIVGLIVLSASASGWLWRHQSRVHWARTVALPEAERLLGEGRFHPAYQVLEAAERYVPDDPLFRELLKRAAATWTITTQPEGADVSVRDFYGEANQWESLGRTPVRGERLASGMNIFKVSLDGFQSVEVTRTAFRVQGPRSIHFSLQPAATAPPRMIFIPAPQSDWSPTRTLPSIPMQDFWLDKYEVTNREFEGFVASGAYSRPELWSQVFDREGRRLAFGQASQVFVDRTGRPGPSQWELAAYPEGEDDYPVSGVSWYEASTYCRWLGKQLPTLHHWSYAAGFGAPSNLFAPESNFDSNAPEPVGGPRRLGRWGAYDMAGNVKEWVQNEAAPNRRYLLGGGWNEPSYMFGHHDFRPAIDRDRTNGFRCAKFISPPASEGFARMESPSRDYRVESPVSDGAFAVIAAMYRYNRRPLDARVERTDNRGTRWRIEQVSFTAAYGTERVSALLFFPRNALAPYQTVIRFPGPLPFRQRIPLGDVDAPGAGDFFEFLIRDGRAIALPAVMGSYNRHLGQREIEDIWAEVMLAGSQDIGRLIDYLETRDDIDAARIAYVGVSLGAGIGPIMTAMEPRFKASVLIAGGLHPFRPPPHADALNFVPRVRTPTLMVTGKHDFFFPYDRSQKPMLDLLPMAREHKRLKAFESGHIPTERVELQKEALAWLDRYLGRVRKQ